MTDTQTVPRARTTWRRVARPFLAVTVTTVILLLGTGGAAVVAPSSDGEGPQFYSGVAVDVSGTVDGDVYAAGQSVTVSGDVTGDIIAAAQTITINGTVDGNVRLAGQAVTISGEVARSATVFAQSLRVDEGALIDADVVGATGATIVSGDIGRDVYLSTERLRVDGSIGGDLTYVSGDEAQIADGAVAGSVERIEPPETPRMEVSPWAVFVGWLLGALFALVSLSLITLAAGLLIPRWLDRVTDHLIPSPWKALLVGFIGAIAVPPALLVLAVTVVGFPLALAGLLVWTLMVLATFIYSAHYLGRLIFRDRVPPVVSALAGGVLLIIGLHIPWLNILVWLAMVLFGLGAQLLEVHRQRPWHVERRARDAAEAPDDVGVAVPGATTAPPAAAPAMPSTSTPPRPPDPTAGP
ncbi:polymer-forming cytoskeletal protein [Microbacterium sp. CCNWLW134]|uniref:bactofilin family protein n=1 Tax=Microbacterium sp. CCNWLW134 TaxID=3122064 RepID=UPI0030104C3A